MSIFDTNKSRAETSAPKTQMKKTSQRSSRPSTKRPVYRMSVGLIDTYKTINKKYYAQKKTRQQPSTNGSSTSTDNWAGVYNSGYDDDEYNYIVTENEVFADRYVLKERIGKGSFGQVVRAVDQETGDEVAIKIIKSKRQFMLQAKTELDILTLLKEGNDLDQHNIVDMITSFVYRNHQCFVFEKLSYNLYELLKKSNFDGVSLNLVRKFGNEILKTLAFLARPEINVIHCDLKPENILLRHEKKSAIKVIDFGSSCRAHQRMFSYIQSRFYRSPEVLLGLTYDTAIDVWSLGCILVEMHTGEPAFSGADEVEQMYRIVKSLGMPPSEMLDASPDQHRSKFFEHDGFGWRVKDPSKLDALRQKNLEDILGVSTGGPGGRRQGQLGHDVSVYTKFHDLASRLLALDPADRCTPEEALDHPFLRMSHSILPAPSSPAASYPHPNRADAGTQTG
mmetsp:Transcript_25733/g.38702  ORF Transcript_25733/g.38702 Transcript_25733/m.38702 type:complete len:451 (+) Transcript_25733:291-1643(+)